jgi:hypothetical protein
VAVNVTLAPAVIEVLDAVRVVVVVAGVEFVAGDIEVVQPVAQSVAKTGKITAILP